MEELRKALKVGSKRTVLRYLGSLEQAGEIERLTGRARGVKLRRPARPSTEDDAAAPTHGRAISAEEVERVVSRQFSPQRFAGLCNAIAWSASKRRCTWLPSFTERVNAKDHGIDAEWQEEFPNDGGYASPLLGPGWNVFQYKQRDVFAQGRDRTVAGLGRGLEGAAKDLAKRTGRWPARYVLFTNIDLTHATEGQKGGLKRQILNGWPRSRKPTVHIVGAGELASFLNSAPAVRSAFFAPTRFATWDEAWRSLTKEKLFGASVPLTGRDAELEQVRSLLDDTGVRALVVAGPHEIGKSRLALQASATRPIETIVTLDPRSMRASDLLALESPDTETLVIIEDPDADSAEDFVRQAISRERLKLLITVPTAEHAPSPNFGRDARVRVIRLGPLSDTHAQALLRAAGAKFDYGLESWTVHQAGGNPGVLLLAASVGELRRSAASFVDDVAQAFERKVVRVLGEQALQILRILSLLTHVGVTGPPARELELICRVYGDGLGPNAVLRALTKLADAGVVRVGGAYAEVVPPLFANALAGAAFQARFAELCALFAELGQAGRLRLIRRLRGLRSEEAARFWDELFGSEGLLRDLESALHNNHLLRLIAGAAPQRVARLVEEGLRELSLDERRDIIRDEARRQLMWALEELLSRKKSSGLALRGLALLAEAENETYGNNATEIFCEAFHALHPQMPLPLDERLAILDDLLQEPHSIPMRVVAVKGIEAALGRCGGVMLRRSEGPEPLDSRPTLTYGEIWRYMEALARLLMQAAQSSEDPVARAAQNALPHAIAECAIQARPEEALTHFKALTEWVTSRSVPIVVADLTDALAWVRDEFGRRQNEAEAEEVRAKAAEFVRTIDALIESFNRGDFGTRLGRWAGKWGHDDHELEGPEGSQVYRSDKELRGLAREAVDDPRILTDDLLAWLCSGEAQKAHMFFWWLGQEDGSQSWRARMEPLGTDRSGLVAFASYFGGLSRRHRDGVSRRLDELTAHANVTGEAIVSATGYLGGDAAGVGRVEALLFQKRVDPAFAARTLACGGWINSLSPDEYLRLLMAIAGRDLEHAVAVIDFLGMWLHGRRAVEGDLADFAWRCLETIPHVKGNEGYHCEQLAAHLTAVDPERGLGLLRRALTQPYVYDRWDPLAERPQRKFWPMLLQTARARALRLVLSLALPHSVAASHISWNLRGVLDLERDADILFGFALENERQAELIASTVTAGRPGFWPIALRIVEAYPKSERIQGALVAAAEHMGLVIAGPLSTHYEACRREVAQVKSDPATPPRVRPWLQRVEEYLRERSERELLSEAEEEVNELRRIVEDPEAQERLWAVSTLLRLGKTEMVVRLLSRPEMLRILPKLKVPARERQKIRRHLNEPD
jgi:hypothetical protein